MDILIENVNVLSPDQDAMLEGQNVAISGGRIERITAEPLAPEPGTRRIAGRDRLLIPGLISAHAHSPENLLKARIEAVPLELWLLGLYNSSCAFTAREIYLAAMIGAIELLRSGGTAILDHFWVAGPMNETALDAVMAAYRDVGIRAGVAPLVEDDDKINQMILRENPDLAGGVYGTTPPIDAEGYLAVLEGFFEKWHGAEQGRLQCLAGPSGAQWCSERLMTGSMEIAERYDGGLHMHVEETKLQAVSCRKFFGRSTVAYLAERGLLKERTSLAHCVWIDDHDIDLIAEAGATVAHNSVCNLKLGSGFAPVLRMVERGVHVALACDGAASNDNVVMFDAMKTAGLMHTVRSQNHHEWLHARKIVQMATMEGARALRLQGQLGVVKPGARADLALLDLTTPAFTPLNDPFQHLVYCERGSSVRTVLVDGRVVVDEGRVATVDEEALLAEAREAWARRKAQIPPLSPEAAKFVATQELYQQRIMTQPFVVDSF